MIAVSLTQYINTQLSRQLYTGIEFVWIYEAQSFAKKVVIFQVAIGWIVTLSDFFSGS